MQSPFPPNCAQKYEAQRVLAAGGYGTVYLATQVNLGRPVAIKLMHGSSTTDSNQVARFRLEARVTASLSHPHIVKVLDHDVEEGVSWIAYEYLTGSTLRKRLDEGPFDLVDALTILSQVVTALQVAHAKSVLHRDIKPENVIEDRPGHFKVADFGIAKWHSQGGIRTAEGIILGTPGYVAPELILGTPPSPSSDFYAAGVLFFELVTGRLPFTGETPSELLRKHLSAPVPRPSDIDHTLRPIDGMVAKLLAKAPEDRYQDASELVAKTVEILEILQGGLFAPEPVRPRAPGAPGAAAGPRETAPREGRRSRLPVGAGLASIVLGTGLVAGLVIRGRVDPAPRSAPSPGALLRDIQEMGDITASRLQLRWRDPVLALDRLQRGNVVEARQIWERARRVEEEAAPPMAALQHRVEEELTDPVRRSDADLSAAASFAALEIAHWTRLHRLEVCAPAIHAGTPPSPEMRPDLTIGPESLDSASTRRIERSFELLAALLDRQVRNPAVVGPAVIRLVGTLAFCLESKEFEVGKATRRLAPTASFFAAMDRETNPLRRNINEMVRLRWDMLTSPGRYLESPEVEQRFEELTGALAAAQPAHRSYWQGVRLEYPLGLIRQITARIFLRCGAFEPFRREKDRRELARHLDEEEADLRRLDRALDTVRRVQGEGHVLTAPSEIGRLDGSIAAMLAAYRLDRLRELAVMPVTTDAATPSTSPTATWPGKAPEPAEALRTRLQSVLGEVLGCVRGAKLDRPVAGPALLGMLLDLYRMKWHMVAWGFEFKDAGPSSSILLAFRKDLVESRSRGSLVASTLLLWDLATEQPALDEARGGIEDLALFVSSLVVHDCPANVVVDEMLSIFDMIGRMLASKSGERKLLEDWVLSRALYTMKIGDLLRERQQTNAGELATAEAVVRVHRACHARLEEMPDDRMHLHLLTRIAEFNLKLEGSILEQVFTEMAVPSSPSRPAQLTDRYLTRRRLSSAETEALGQLVDLGVRHLEEVGGKSSCVFEVATRIEYLSKVVRSFTADTESEALHVQLFQPFRRRLAAIPGPPGPFADEVISGYWEIGWQPFERRKSTKRRLHDVIARWIAGHPECARYGWIRDQLARDIGAPRP